MRQTTRTTTVKTHSQQTDITSEDDHEATHCPECDARIATDDGTEKYCPSCGLVTSQDNIDRGPEWRAFSHAEKQQKSRTGSPMTNTHHDKGLSTQIDWKDRDANGNSLSSRKRRKMQRLRRWDEQSRTKDSKERNLKQALSEINRMTAALDLPDNVNEMAAVIYRRAVDEDLLVGRSIEGVATASLYCACRQSRVPRTMNDVGKVSRVAQSKVSSSYRYLSNELGLELPPSDPQEFIPSVASNASVPDRVRAEAENIVRAYADDGAHSGRHPQGVAAASLYTANKLLGDLTNMTQEDAANAGDVCVVTIRSRHEELIEYDDAIESDPEDVDEYVGVGQANTNVDDAGAEQDADDSASSDETPEIDVEEVTLTEVDGGKHLVVVPSNVGGQNDVLKSVVEILINDRGLMDEIELPYAPSRWQNYSIVNDPETDAPEQTAQWHELSTGHYINTKIGQDQKESLMGYLGDEVGIDIVFGDGWKEI